MRWLVDGNNVMGSRPDGWWKDRQAARARLVDHIDRWQRATGNEVVVIFDGGADPGVEARSRRELLLRFSGSTAPNSADDVLAELARSAPPGELTVVTSDRALAQRLPEGVLRLGAGTFRDLLDDVDGDPPDGRGRGRARPSGCGTGSC